MSGQVRIPFSRMPKRYGIEVEDSKKIRGTVKFDVTIDESFRRPGDVLRVFCYFSHTKSTSCEFSIGDDGKEFYMRLDHPFSIRVNDNEVGTLLGEMPADGHLPLLCVSVYARVTDDITGGGWGQLGFTCIRLDKKKQVELQLYNLALNVFLKESIFVGTVSNVVCDIEYQCKGECRPQELLADVIKEFIFGNTESIMDNFDYDIAGLTIEEPMVALHSGIVPKPFYYCNNANRINVTNEWLLAQIKFSMALGKWNHDKTKAILNATGDDVPEQWSDFMCIVIRAFSWFITRFDYVPDNIRLSGDRNIKYENFTGDMTTTNGFYDCEDGAWLFMAFLQRLQELNLDLLTDMSDDNKETLAAVKRALGCYVITNAVVFAQLPQIWSKLSPSEPQNSFYHMTCFLINKETFYKNSSIAKKEEDKNLPGFTEKLPWLHAESTSNIYPDQARVFYADNGGPNWIAMQAVFNAEGENPRESPHKLVAIPTRSNNGDGGCAMILAVYYLYTEYFIKEIGTTEFVVTKKNQTRNEIGILLQNTDVTDAKYTHTRPMTSVLTSQRVKDIVGFEPPPNMLFIDLERFENELKKLSLSRPVIWNAWFSQFKFRDNKTDFSEKRIPYLAWNMTNEEPGEVGVTEWFIVLEDAITDTKLPTLRA